jgi:general secretion pathway protein G
MKKKNIKNGFSLIELLVVISIIGILMALSMFGIKNARESSRDGKRKSDLETIRSALELYKADVGSYPASLGSSISQGGQTYLDSVPKDPLDPARNYSYATSGTPPTTYILCAALENPVAGASTTGCASCGENCNYKVKNP